MILSAGIRRPFRPGISVILAHNVCHFCPTTFVHISHTSRYMRHIFILFSFLICASPSRTCGRTSFNHMRTPSLHLLHRAHSTPCTFDTDHIGIHSLHLQPQDAFYRIHWWSTPPFTTFSSPATFKYIPLKHIRRAPALRTSRHIQSRHIRAAFTSFFPAATFSSHHRARM